MKRPEAISLVNLKNAVRALRDEDVVSFKTDGTGITLDDPLSEHAEDIRSLLSEHKVDALFAGTIPRTHARHHASYG